MGRSAGTSLPLAALGGMVSSSRVVELIFPVQSDLMSSLGLKSQESGKWEKWTEKKKSKKKYSGCVIYPTVRGSEP